MENSVTTAEETLLENELIEPIAIIEGQQVFELPKDLYIPPEAMRVFLDTFEGPLDLLLYLIKKENIDILDIPIAKITEQYVQYVEMMQELQLELAAEYLVMAALLAEIKSRMLLPPDPTAAETEETDPRAELVRKLQEYERYKQAALTFHEMPKVDEEIFCIQNEPPKFDTVIELPMIKLEDLLTAWQIILRRAKLNQHHHIQFENLSVRDRMTHVLQSLQNINSCGFIDLIKITEGRLGIVVTLMALLELLKQFLIEVEQTEIFGAITIRGNQGERIS